MHYCFQFSVSFFVNCMFISLPHFSTKLLVYFLLICGRFSWGQDFFKLYYDFMLTDLLLVALGKHTHYFPADLFPCHAENKAKGSKHSAHSLDHCARGTHVFLSAFREAFPGIPGRNCTCSHQTNPRMAHPNSPFVMMEMLYICTVQFRGYLLLVETELLNSGLCNWRPKFWF